MKDNNKLLTIGAILSIILFVSVVSFCSYKIMKSKINDSNIQNNNSNKLSESDIKAKEDELLSNGYKIIDYKKENEDIVDVSYDIYNLKEEENQGLIYLENGDKKIDEERVVIGIENKKFYVSYLDYPDLKIYVENVKNVAKAYLEPDQCGGLYIFLLTEEGDFYTAYEDERKEYYSNNFDVLYEYDSTQNETPATKDILNEFNKFEKINDKQKYKEIFRWDYESTCCDALHYYIGETENNEKYLIFNEDKFNYVDSNGSIFITKDNRVYKDKKDTGIILKYYLGYKLNSYILSEDDYLYDSYTLKKESSKKVKSIYLKEEDGNLFYRVIFEDGSLKNIDFDGEEC